jgi:hypothetical protein
MMRSKLCTLALVLGLSPLAMLAPSAVAQDRDRDRDDRQQGTWTRNNDLQNALHQRVPNSNIAVNWQNNNTVVLTGTAATERDRQYADQLVRSQVGNARVIDQVSVNGYNSAYGYPNNGTYSNGYPNNGTYSNGDRDRDRDSRIDADRDRARTDADRNDNDRDDHAQMKDKDRDHDKKYKNKKDKDKDKDKKDKDDRGDRDNDNNRPH